MPEALCPWYGLPRQQVLKQTNSSSKTFMKENTVKAVTLLYMAHHGAMPRVGDLMYLMGEPLPTGRDWAQLKGAPFGR